MSLPPAVLWIDPGKMTGLACYMTRLRPYYMCDEYAFQETGIKLEAWCRGYAGDLWIGWEQFDIRPKTPPSDAHYAIEVIGLTRWNAQRYGCKILTPAKQEQRKIATRTMLEALDWWLPGKDDAQSAAQHMLAWMLRTGNTPGREATILAALRK